MEKLEMTVSVSADIKEDIIKRATEEIKDIDKFIIKSAENFRDTVKFVLEDIMSEEFSNTDIKVEVKIF